MNKLLTFCLFALMLNSCSLTSCSDDPSCKRVLFIGNSYTFTNDLPGTLVKLARSGGDRLETGFVGEGGWMLTDQLKSASTLDSIKSSKWNYVVLQEQSMVPASVSVRTTQMYPAARGLAQKIIDAGAKPLLFITWAHQAGWPENGTPNYESMQLAVNMGYLTLGQHLRLQMAPVGYAWLALWRQNPQLSLWQADGSHPNELGTYLAACVFYAVLFQKSPQGLSYRGSLSKENTAQLQKIADDTVFKNLMKWNLPWKP